MDKKKKKDIQLRFSHYLKSYRCSKNITQEQLANDLGVTKILISKYESTHVTDNRLISSFEFLESFANLEKSTVSEFLSYLEDNEKGQLPYWNERLFKAFSSLEVSTQFGLISALSELKKDKETVNLVFNTALLLLTVNKEQRDLISKVIHMSREINERKS